MIPLIKKLYPLQYCKTLTLSSLTKGVINYIFEIIFARISCEAVYYICELYCYAMVYSECIVRHIPTVLHLYCYTLILLLKGAQA